MNNLNKLKNYKNCGNHKEQAVDAVENASMPWNYVSRIFHACCALEQRFKQVAQGGGNHRGDAHHYPGVDAQRLRVEKGVECGNTRYCYSESDDKNRSTRNTLPRLLSD